MSFFSNFTMAKVGHHTDPENIDTTPTEGIEISWG